LWGELAWQLGGREGYELVAEADRTSTSPGDELRKLLAAYGPCLVLIDEWVAYARQLYAADDLPGGSFDAHFSFAQALTEAARAVRGALLLGQGRSQVVAGATLALAAVFQPARRRVQGLVDRRFNRRRYDAAQTIEAFAVRLRQQVDLDALRAELLAVVDQTMQPTRASLWLRP
jgi:predicted AAA+ superfamily ATPase